MPKNEFFVGGFNTHDSAQGDMVWLALENEEWLFWDHAMEQQKI